MGLLRLDPSLSCTPPITHEKEGNPERHARGAYDEGRKIEKQ
jgi:hypothetical protein